MSVPFELAVDPADQAAEADLEQPRPAESFDEYVGRRRAAIPPMVYLPVTGAAPEGFVEVIVRTTKDGRTALLAYTALDRLVRCCGPHQPWTVHPTDRLHELGGYRPFDVIYLDLSIPEDLRYSPESGAQR